MKLTTHIVEKPWGRRDIPAAFGDMGGKQIGEIWFDAPGGGKLPLLVKWLFTSEKLSVQVHPDDAQARARGLPSGKEECWFIVDAEPGAVIGMGTSEELSRQRLRDASISGEIEALLDWRPVSAGDYFYIPAGTIHAIGAGITLVEVQQNADVTYRLYDYGRPRELHLGDAVAVSNAVPYADPRSGQAASDMKLVDSKYFRLWMAQGQAGLAAIPAGCDRWLIPLAGEVRSEEHIGKVGDCLLAGPDQTIAMSPDCQLLVASQ